MLVGKNLGQEFSTTQKQNLLKHIITDCGKNACRTEKGKLANW